MSEVFSFPFIQPWMSEAADAISSEPPTLRLVQNGRFRRLGKISKRTGLLAANTSVATNSPAVSGRPMLIGDFNGRQILIGGDGLLYARSGDWTGWTAQDRVPTFTPERAQEIARDDGEGPLASPSVAATGFGHMMTGYNTANDTVLSLFDTPGTKLWSWTLPGEFRPKVLAVSMFSFVVITRSGTTLNVRTFDPNSLILSAPTAHGPLNATTDNWDANVVSMTHFAIFYRSAATTARVELIDSTTLALGATNSFTINNQPIMPAILAPTLGGDIYAAYWDPQTTRSVRARVYNSALVLSSGGTVTMGDSVGFATKPVIAGRDATSAHILWGGNSTSGDRLIRHRTITNAGVLGGTTSEIRNVHLVSEAFESNTERIRLWVQQAGSGYVFCRYVLITLRLDSFGTWEAQPELHTDAGWVPHVQTYENLPSAQVATLGNGEYCVAVKRRIRGELGTSAINNVGVVLLRYRGASTAREAHRQGIEAQRVYHVTGGELIEHMGSAFDESLNANLFTGVENNFLAPPVIVGETVTAGGFLTPESAPAAQDSVYQYCCCYETLDSAGRRTRSLPSNIVTVRPTAANRTGSLTVTTCGVSGRRLKDSAQPTTITVYRTQSNGQIFQRVSSDVTAPNAFANAAETTVTDAEADTSIATREAIYITREAGNYPCPSHRFGVQGGNRMFVAGLWDPTLVAVSKPFVPDEPLQFVEDNAFRILSPVNVTALGWLDGSLVIFGERSIYIASGSGPDRQGSGAYGAPQPLPGDIGCTDWRSVREVPQGLLFMSNRGFYLLPRGFGAPVFQPDVQDHLAEGYYICFGAGRHDERRHGESSLVYLMARGDVPAFDEVRGFAYNLETGKWSSVDTHTEGYTLIGTWQGQLALATDDVSDAVSMMAFNDDRGNFIETHVRTGQIHPFGFGGMGQVHEIVIQGEWRGQALLGITLKVDGLTSYTLTPSAATRINAVNGTTLNQGDKFYFRWQTPRIQGNSFEVELWDAYDAGLGFPSEGLAFHGFSMLVDPIDGHKPLGSGNRS